MIKGSHWREVCWVQSKISLKATGRRVLYQQLVKYSPGLMEKRAWRLNVCHNCKARVMKKGNFLLHLSPQPNIFKLIMEEITSLNIRCLRFLESISKSLLRNLQQHSLLQLIRQMMVSKKEKVHNWLLAVSNKSRKQMSLKELKKLT